MARFLMYVVLNSMTVRHEKAIFNSIIVNTIVNNIWFKHTLFKRKGLGVAQARQASPNSVNILFYQLQW